MDDYGCAHVTQEDAELIRSTLSEYGSIVFPLTGDSMGCMIIHLTGRFEKVGIMPFGGKPDGRIYVGVHGIGCGHFAPAETHAGYFAEKLGLPKQDAETLAAFWSLMWSSK